MSLLAPHLLRLRSNVPGRLLFAGLLLAAAGAAGCSKSEAKPAPPPVSSAPVKGRLVEVAATSAGYEPGTIELKAGETVTLRFTRKTKSDCLAEVVITDLSIKKELPVDVPVDVEVKFDKPGSYAFQCGMAMVKGTLHVT